MQVPPPAPVALVGEVVSILSSSARVPPVFTQYLPEMQEAVGASRAAVAGAFSIALVTQAISAPMIGRLLDRVHPSVVLTSGSIGNVVGVLVWPQARNLPTLYAAWALLGVTMAATLYDAAFTVVAKWYDGERRRRALTAVTLAAGLASFIFLPIEAALVEAHGLRRALVILASALGVVTVPLHAFALRRPPQQTRRSSRDRSALGTRQFRFLAMASIGAAFVTSGLAIHQVAYFRENGFTAAAAGFATGVIGAMQLVGRLAFTPLMRRARRTVVTTISYALFAAALAVLTIGSSTATTWVFVAAYGTARGMTTLVRAVLVAELFGPERYGAVSGSLSGLTGAAQAVAPLAVGLAYDTSGGYTPVLWMLTGLATFAAARIESPGTGPGDTRGSAVE